MSLSSPTMALLSDWSVVKTDLSWTNLGVRIYTCALSAGVSGGIIVSGLISINLHWRYIYWVSTALIGACTLFVICGFPETMYRRDDESLIRNAEARNAAVPEKDDVKPDCENVESTDPENGVSSPPASKRGFVAGLRLFSGVYTKETLLSLFARPLALFLLPSVFWATLVMAGTIGFLVAITSNFASAFETAYSFEPWMSGLCFIAALIGSFIGIFIGGHFSDWVADFQTRRNDGIREPEMRLPAIGVSVITAPLALILYGVGIEYQLHWMCPTIGLALSMFPQETLLSKAHPSQAFLNPFNLEFFLTIEQ